MVPTMSWRGAVDGWLQLLDQTRLPREIVQLECRDVETVERAIRSLQVRGAPAIGVSAAFGVCLGVQPAMDNDEATFFQRLDYSVNLLAKSRPTAVNLFAALRRIQAVALARRGHEKPRDIARAMLDDAQRMFDEDAAMCRAIGAHGAEMLADGMGLLTHCNAGGLATCGIGTALAIPITAHEEGKRLHVFVDETRPLLQGARLTAWELFQHGIASTLICDSMAAQVMREGRVQAVIVGADRIAANGDTANKIGTYGVAMLAHAHGIPFYVAAPVTTFDLSLPDGSGIPIEQRDGEEITRWKDHVTAPDGMPVYNPAFDVTPARLITALITDRGVIAPVGVDAIRSIVERGK